VSGALVPQVSNNLATCGRCSSQRRLRAKPITLLGSGVARRRASVASCACRCPGHRVGPSAACLLFVALYPCPRRSEARGRNARLSGPRLRRQRCRSLRCGRGRCAQTLEQTQHLWAQRFATEIARKAHHLLLFRIGTQPVEPLLSGLAGFDGLDLSLYQGGLPLLFTPPLPLAARVRPSCRPVMRQTGMAPGSSRRSIPVRREAQHGVRLADREPQ